MPPPSLLSQVVIDATNRHMDVKEDGGGAQTASITVGTYADMFAVYAAFQVAIRALGGNLAAATVELSTAGSVPGCTEIFLDADGQHPEVEWLNGGSAPDNCGRIMGFDVTADNTGDGAYVSDFQHMFGWYSLRYPHRYGPLKPKFIGGEAATTLSGKNDKVVKIGFHYFYVVDLVMMVPEIVLETSAVGANINRDFVTVWKDAIAKNAVRWRDDQTVEGTYHTLYLQEPRSLEDLVRAFDDYEAYDLRLKFRRKEV